jgi:SAM-dependent methyltransferase
MTCRCADVGLDEMFDEQFAVREAKRYRRKGLPRRASILLELIRNAISLAGRTSLEGGTGAGALSVELARQGVTRAVGVDAIPAAIDQARELAHELNVADRAHFTIGDFADSELSLLPADVVVLDRVVCCYPDWRALLTRAATHASRVVALTYPPDNALSRFEVGAVNAFQRMMGRRFRVHVHSAARMFALLAEHGFTSVKKRRYWFWEIAVASRS